MDIAVVGAGPAGIMSALQAATGSARVTLFDHNDAIGRKLLVTGSGRCNLSNAAVAPEAYYCADPAWMRAFLGAFSVGELMRELDNLGIPTRHTDDGWYYPLSESAHAVVEILLENLKQRCVRLQLATSVTSIAKAADKFILELHAKGRNWIESYDRVVIAAGGRAYPELGSRGELFPFLQTLGHTVKPLLPALGPIYAELGDLKELQGLRFDVWASILQGKRCLGTSQGNVIINKGGLNGPGVMNLSHLVHLHAGEALTLRLDFWAPHADALSSAVPPAGGVKTLRVLLLRVLPPKAADLVLRSAHTMPDLDVRSLGQPAQDLLLKRLLTRELLITGAGNYKNSQVTVGGVPVTEVRADTLESLRAPGLYLAGETLDVTGPCGGYNLHFAFGSGCLAGRHLASNYR